MSNNIWVTKVTDAPRASTQQRDVLGSIRWIGNKCYKYVQLAASQSADVDFAANGDAIGYSDYSAHTVCADATDAAQGGAGILVNFDNWDGDFSDHYSSYMWIQIKGPATVGSMTVGSPSALDQISLDTGTADKVFEKRTTLTQSNGVYLAATEAILDCPF